MKTENEKIILELDNLFNVQSRTIYFESPIDCSITSYIQQRVNLISAISGDNKSPITLELSSYGGDAYAALAIIDVIQSFPMKINIFGRGSIMSAGALILISGTGIRSMSKNATLMLHSISALDLAGTSENVMIEAKHTETLNNLVRKMIADNSNKSLDYWQEATRSNLYMRIPGQTCH